MIAGLIPPDAGSISVGGHDTLDGSMAARGLIGYMPESSPLYEEMTAEGLLRFRAELRGIGRRERGAAVGKAIERCRLEDVRRRRVVALSKGYRQRVALASAILGEPSLVILDEPTSGLDPSQVLETRRLVRELGERSAVLITSHVLGEIEAMCAKVIIIARGQVLAQGSLADLAREASAGNGTLRHVVEVRAAAARCGCFAGVAGVVGSRVVELGDGWTRVEIEPSGATPDLRERLGDVARAVHVSPNYLTGLFRAETGTPLGKFILAERMALAQVRLGRAGASVKAVALELGFADPFAFSRAFKRATGRSPRAWAAVRSGSLAMAS
jgi:ABC-2 type transport system ATP-binding protein